MQAPLAAVSLSAFISWWLDRSLPWLIGGVLLLQELDLRSEEAGSLLRRWGRLHAVRSILGGTAFLMFLFTLVGRR
jgi:hypothetical protein